MHAYLYNLHSAKLNAWPSIIFSPIVPNKNPRKAIMKKGFLSASAPPSKRSKTDRQVSKRLPRPHSLPALTHLIRRTRKRKTIDDYTRDLLYLYTRLPQDLQERWDFDDPSWLSKTDLIMNLIEQIQSPVSQCNTMSAVRGALKKYDNGEQHLREEDIYDLYADGSKLYISNYKNRAKEQKEIHCSWEELEHHRDALAVSVKQLKARYKSSLPQQGWEATPFDLTGNDKKLMLNHLILSLYTYHEPRRAEYANVRYYEGPLPTTTAPNYIHNPNPSERPVPQFILMLRDYKTSATEGPYMRACVPDLNKVLYDSFRLWPRDWLLTLNTITPMGPKNLSKQVAKIMPNAQITITWMRKMYVSMRYKGEKSWKDHAELAKHMGHTVQTQMQDYNVL